MVKHLLDLLEKLVNEHASAAVQKERGDMLKEALVELEKENTSLKGTVGTLTAKVAELEKELSKYDRPHLGDRLLADVCHHADATPQERAARLEAPVVAVEHFFDTIRANGKMIDAAGHITGEGVRHLASKHLL